MNDSLSPALTSPDLLVLSASRRTDLVSCYPDLLVEKLSSYPPDQVHTVVIWTKNPANMLAAGRLRKALASYAQLYIHLTITGLGASLLEPRIPAWQQVVAMVPEIIALARDPRRVSWRFDPIVRAETGGTQLSNLELFPHLAERLAACGITTCRTSWVEPYRKVVRRTDKKGVRLLIPSLEERHRQAYWLEKEAAACGISLHYCAMQGFARSRCIDGELLCRLHPTGAPCSLRKAKGQRTQCGCTESLDLGWYSLKCRNACLYCYAEPLIE